MGLPGYYLDVPGNLVLLPCAPRWGDPVDGGEVLDILHETQGGSRHGYTQATRAIRSFNFRFSRADKADFLLLHNTVFGRALTFFFVPDTDDMDTFIFCRKEKDFRTKEVPMEAVVGGSVTSLFDYTLELTAEPAVTESGRLVARGTSTAEFVANLDSFLSAAGDGEGAFVGESTFAGVLTAPGIGAAAFVGIQVAWSQIGGDSLNSGWSGKTNVNLCSGANGHIYAAVSGSAGEAEVWEWDGADWTQVGGDAINSSWSTSYETCGSPTFRASDGHLFVGLGSSTGDAEIWEFNGTTTWTKIGGDGLNSSWNTNYETIGSMCFDASGNLIVGIGLDNGDAEVYSWDGATWTKIGGDSVNSSWSSAGNYNQLRGLTLHDDGSGDAIFCGLGIDAGEGEVWKFQSGSWTKIGGDGINSGFTSELVNTLHSHSNGLLYAGIGLTAANGGQVWSWNGTAWANVSGFGTGYERAFSMATLDGVLYAGLGSGAGDADVWRYSGSGTTWTKVGGDAVALSWTTNYEIVTGLLGHTDGNLYAGLGTTSGDGEVWKWNLAG